MGRSRDAYEDDVLDIGKGHCWGLGCYEEWPKEYIWLIPYYTDNCEGSVDINQQHNTLVGHLYSYVISEL